jgi:hypothetical protein
VRRHIFEKLFSDPFYFVLCANMIRIVAAVAPRCGLPVRLGRGMTFGRDEDHKSRAGARG